MLAISFTCFTVSIIFCADVTVNGAQSQGGYCHTKAVGVCHQSPMEHMEREREIKKFMVTKRELLKKISNIYKCKVSPGGTFSLGNFLFNERENYHV